MPQRITGAPWIVENTGNVHIISVYRSAFENLKKGDIIAVFNNEGICTGMTQYRGGNDNLALIVYGDDITTEAVDGMMVNEPMKFVVYSPSTEEMQQVQVNWDMSMPNTGSYVNNGLSAITSFKFGALGIGQVVASTISVYPNPATDKVMISVNGNISSDAKVQVFDTRGTKLITRAIQTESTTLPVDRLEEGMYILRITNNGVTQIEKLIIRK